MKCSIRAAFRVRGEFDRTKSSLRTPELSDVQATKAVLAVKGFAQHGCPPVPGKTKIVLSGGKLSGVILIVQNPAALLAVLSRRVAGPATMQGLTKLGRPSVPCGKTANCLPSFSISSTVGTPP